MCMYEEGPKDPALAPRPSMMYCAYGAGIAQSVSDGLRAGLPGFHSGRGKIFLFSIASRPALGPTLLYNGYGG
jgi:hypothetical protein